MCPKKTLLKSYVFVFAAIVQPSLSITQESMKDVPFSSLILPIGTVSSSLTTPTLSAGSVFTSLSSSKAELDEKGSHLSDLQISSSENRTGKQDNKTISKVVWTKVTLQ